MHVYTYYYTNMTGADGNIDYISPQGTKYCTTRVLYCFPFIGHI